jgi:diguanylate cyclase
MSTEELTRHESAQTPAVLAKGALRRLAQARLEPTPENYARAYAEEAGRADTVLPERARALLDRLIVRAGAEPGLRDEVAAALMAGRWDAAGAALERLGDAAAASRAWAELIERAARGLERAPSRQWTVARKRESLQRVLDGSRSDAARLQQRLLSLLAAWDADRPEEIAAHEASVAASAVARPSSGAATAEGAGQWPQLVDALAATAADALPSEPERARELARRLAVLAAQIGERGAAADLVAAVAAACDEARAFFRTRARLVDELSELARELGRGLTELAEDDSWARGQCASLEARLEGEMSVRSVRAAAAVLHEARQRQQRLRGEREQARQALKTMIQRMLHELGELGAHTGRFEQSIERHAQAIERADSLESLAGVVREIVTDSRAVHAVVSSTQQRLVDEHARAIELEARVRELEAELTRIAEEASTDALTQVANRRGIQLLFERECARVERAPGSVLALGLIDIDNFKKLNDSLGHAAGDKALQALAKVVGERLRPTDHVGRFGGEEFVVIMPGTAAADACSVLTRLQRSLSASLFLHDDKEVFVTFSAGVTAWRPGETLDAALERADGALYEAKRTGKNRTCVA